MRKPRKGSLQESFHEIRADWNAAKANRFRRVRSGVPVAGASADYHYRSESDLFRMMEYARDMDRNDAVVGQMIDRAVLNTIQSGMALDVNTGDTALDQDLAAMWKAWADNPQACDESSEMSFVEMEGLIFRHVLVDGDILVNPVKSGALQLIEAHRLRSIPRAKASEGNFIVHGVEVSPTRKRVSYIVTNDDLDPMRTVQSNAGYERIPAYNANGYPNIFHVMLPRRVSQTRGVSALAPVFDFQGMFDDVNFATLVKQQVAACMTFFRERDINYAGGAAGALGEQEEETTSDAEFVKIIEQLRPGMLLTGQPGEKLTGISPSVPNPEYFQHMRMILQILSTNLGLPLCVTLLDGSETNFTGWRGAVDQARIGWRRNQLAFISRFHRKVYEWKVRGFMLKDQALYDASKKSTVNIYGHNWNPPTWPYIQPREDAETERIRLSNALTSPRRLHAERGREWAELSREIIEDNALAIRAAKAQAALINQEYSEDGQPVSWRDLIPLPLQGGTLPAPDRQEPQLEVTRNAQQSA